MNNSQKKLFFYPSIKNDKLPNSLQRELLDMYKTKGQIIDSIIKSQDSIPIYRKNRRIFLEQLIIFFIEHTYASRYLLRHQEFNFYVYLMLGLKLLYPQNENISFSKTKGGGVGVLAVIRQVVERWKLLNKELATKLIEQNRVAPMDFADFSGFHQKYSFEIDNILYLFTPDFYDQSNVRVSTEYNERMYYLIGLLKEYTNLDSLYINPYEQIYNIKEKIQNACQSICPDFNIAGGAKNGVKMLLYAYNQFDDSVPLYEPTDYRGRGRYENQKRWEQQFLDMERRWQQMANKINKMEQELREIRRDKLIH